MSDVKVGQVWRDLDKRMGRRVGTVIELSSSGRIATLRITHGRNTRISVEAMTGKSDTGRSVTRRWALEAE
jgi:hypothetical protein